jgi:DHA3 family macrolide efflux protein-like MFS transporter
MTQKTRPTGMLAFTIVWIGQVVSLLGSAMTWFAFTIWAWQTTGEATVLALVGFFSFGPTLLLSPIAGVLVDRWNRKLVMMVSDLASGLATIVVLSLYATGNLQVWHLYLVGAVAAAFVSFQFPAYSAAVTVMLPKEQYARAQGMMGLASSASGIFGPLLAALLLGVIGIVGIMMIDVVTFLVAIGALLLVHIPQPVVTEAGREGHGSIWKESVYGFRYILERPSLLALQLVLAGSNLVHALGFTLVVPMILARTGNEEIVLGSVQSAGALGPKRRIHGVLIGWTLASLMGGPLMGLGHNLTLWVLASFFSSFFAPIIYGSDQAIWQAKVAPDVQGRVFATRQLISQVTIPIAMLLAGPLADRVLEPAMRPEGNLSGTFGWLVGAGPGAGMALLIVFAGIFGMLVGLGGYAFYNVRNAEDILPDYDGEVALPLEAYA